ncbi:S9 family peptidase [Hypericibacter sp.]|uniref:S9 family peptidase n=1 Tax=Hypericibacter sp. TaxID=2705401 RepID=UPI003D6CAB31
MDSVLPADMELIDRLLALPELERPSLSPDGNWLAWSWSGLGPTVEVWIAPTDGSIPPRCLVANADDLHVEDWWPDSRVLLLSGTQDGAERVRLYRQELAGGAPTLLTEPAPDFYIHGGRVTADGRSLVYAANLDIAIGQPIEPAWIYRHDLDGNRRTLLAKPKRPHHDTPLPSPKGQQVLYARIDRGPGGRQLWLVDLDGKNDRELLDLGKETKLFAHWSPDGKGLAILAEDARTSLVGYYDLAANRMRWLIDDAVRGIEQISWPRRSPEIVVTETKEGRSQVCLLDPATGRERPFRRAPGTWLPLGPVPDRTGAQTAWVVRFYDARTPLRVLRLVGQGETTDLTALPPGQGVPPDLLTAPEDFRWRSVDGLDIHGWLYRATPPSKGLIVWVHGGPTWHLEARYDLELQFLVGAGFDVFAPNYRGSTGYGPDFREAIKKEGWGGLEQEDIRSGIEALIAQGLAQAGRVGIAGVSYGGYSSWWAITHFPTAVVAAAAPICGMTDLVVDYETTRPDLRSYSEEMMGGAPQDVPERYRERSPIHFVRNIRGQLLIVQGLQDPNVTPENLSAVSKALDAAGIPYEVLAFPDEGHGIAKPANRARLNRRLASFFEEALRG